jgi:predicted secreted Zn-dependent protease
MSARGCWGRYSSHHHHEYDISNGNVTQLTVTARPTIEMPRWGGYSRASREEKREWDRMFGALERHEAQHHSRFVDQWNRLKSELGRLRGAVTERQVRTKWSRFDTAVNNAQRGYDRSSRNGQNEGVRLDDPSAS